MDDYLEAFVREGEENVTDLNNALLDLEADPEEEAAMDAIFRTAHTLKGNFAAMGFADASDLAHALEDLLDEMRQGTIAVTADRMDHVFAGVDEIEACLNEIAASGEIDRDVSAVVADVRATTAAGGETGHAAVDAASPTAAEPRSTGDPLSPFDPTAFAAVDGNLFHVRVDLSATQMKGVDAMFVLDAVYESFDLVASEPDLDAISDGAYDTGFDLVVASEDSETAVETTFGGFPKLTAATVTEITDAIPDGTPKSTADDARTEPSAPEARSKPEFESDFESDFDSGPEPEPEPERASIQSVHVDVAQLDDLHGLVEQLVTSRIKLRRSVENGSGDGAGDGDGDGTRDGVRDGNRRAEEELDELDKITSSLQDTVMDMRLVPLKNVVGKFPRLVRDLARDEDKQVEFVVEGDDVEIDRTILTDISDPLMHLLRNAVDHGVEPPSEREAAGKDPTATVTLRAERDRDRVIVEVADDGNGIDVARIREKAVENGIKTPEQAEHMDDEEAADLIFHPGFSTNDEVTDVSGRGVGMDVVRDTVTRLDGTVGVETTPGEGTTFRLTLPVTVAIVKVLFVESGSEKYGIPIKTIDEISRMRPVKRVDGEEVVTYDTDLYPLVRLGDALDVPDATRTDDGMLVRIRAAERQVAVHCDDVRGQEEVVVKPFEGVLSGIPGLSGAAVLGEGDVVTILDVATL